MLMPNALIQKLMLASVAGQFICVNVMMVMLAMALHVLMTLQVHFSVSDGKRNNRSRNAPKFWKESHDVDWDDTDDAESPGRCDATDGPCESHVHIVKAENAFPVFFYIITVKNQTT